MRSQAPRPLDRTTSTASEEQSPISRHREHLREPIAAAHAENALAALNGRWDEMLQSEGAENTRALYSELDPRLVLDDPEAAAVFWLLSSMPPEADPLGPFATRVLAVRDTELSALSHRARLTIRTAAALVWVERRRLDRAEQVVADAFAELEQSDSTSVTTIGPVYTEFLLAAARIRLLAGDLRESARLYREALAFCGVDDRAGIAARALIGQALALSLNAEFDAAQRTIDAARAAAEDTPVEGSAHWIELIFCQSMIWAYRGDDAEVVEAQRDVASRIGDDPAWRALAQILDARVHLREGRCLDAVNVLRNLLRVTSDPRDLLVLQNSAVFLLGLALIKSNQPNAALRIATSDYACSRHSAALPAIAAFAFIERGEPERAIQVTDECVELGRDHPGLTLLYVYGARAMAFEILGLSISAENALSAGLGIAQDAEVQLDEDVFHGPQLELLWERVSARLESLPDGAAAAHAPEPSAGAELGLRVGRLTPKERELLRRLAKPGTLSEVADDLYVSENTIKTHTKSIYRKLAVTSRTEAADLATAWGLG